MPDTTRVTFNLSSELAAVLKEMANQNGNSMTEELKRAISDRRFITDQLQKESEFYVVNTEDDGSRNSKQVLFR